MNHNEERFALITATHATIAAVYLATIIYFVSTGSKVVLIFLAAAVVLMVTTIYGCLIAFKLRTPKEQHLQVLIYNAISVIPCVVASFFLDNPEYSYVCAYTGFIVIVSVAAFFGIEKFCRTGVAPPVNEIHALDNAEPGWNA
uniref:AA_permease_C domain-containing protein n=1 Tax=Panagrellus redivivus TaxID=6233 RepID=A0A7E4V8N1_PANRE